MVEFFPGFSRGLRPAAAIFDWDGTLSLLRGGWGDIMQRQWLDALPPLPGESDADRAALVHDEIWSLNGKPSIHQAARLAALVAGRGGPSREAVEYETDYQRRLGEVTGRRCAAVRSGAATPDAFLVPGARAWLQRLLDRGLHLLVASGTQRRFVAEEADLLGLTRFFAGGIHGPSGDQDTGFTKRAVIDRTAAALPRGPAALVSFGDGEVEIRETRAVGGLPVAVASNEADPAADAPDPAKRLRLSAAGALVCIPHFKGLEPLEDALFS
jgi:phosphoglycolate phosphatase-like HAD superfamily hydrolase